MKHFIYISLLLLAACVSMSAAPAVADTAAAAVADTVAAAKKESQQAVSAQDYFSAGNKAYRGCDYPRAILNYEKARKLAPLNEDIRHNLEITRGKTIDRMPPEGEMFFTRWYKGTMMSMTIDAWAYMSLAALVAALLLYLVYLFVDSMMVRRMAFYLSATLVVVYVIATIMAWQRKHALTTHDTAVIMAEMVTVRSSPTSKSPETCIIHEGTFVRITDKEMSSGKLKDGKGKGWLGIELSDGREGWIEANTVEEI